MKLWEKIYILSIQLHNWGHTNKGQRPHQCKTCAKRFVTKEKLKTHFEAVHEGKKPHKCTICQASFAEKGKLRNHNETVHEGKKPFKCSLCSQCFTRKNSMEKHVSAVHEGKKPFKCPICDKSFGRKSHMQLHISAVHEEKKPFKCSLCNEGFTRKESMQRHISSVHENEKSTSVNSSKNRTKTDLMKQKLSTMSETKLNHGTKIVHESKKQNQKVEKQIFNETKMILRNQDLRDGDFVILKDQLNQDQASIWRFDGEDMMQRYNVSGKDNNGEPLYKSTNSFSGYIPTTNRQR